MTSQYTGKNPRGKNNPAGARAKRSVGRKDSCSNVDVDLCKYCNIAIDSETHALNCNFCDKWICIKCLGIAEALYMAMVDNQTAPVLVPCKECEAHVISIKELGVTLNEVKTKQDNTKSQLDEMYAKLGSISKEMKKNIHESVKREVDH